MLRVYGGAILVIAGIVAFVEADRHHPARALNVHGAHVLGRITLTGPGSEWSQTAYDLVRIGAWTLVISGGLTVIAGLIRLRHRPRGATSHS